MDGMLPPLTSGLPAPSTTSSSAVQANVCLQDAIVENVSNRLIGIVQDALLQPSTDGLRAGHAELEVVVPCSTVYV